MLPADWFLVGAALVLTVLDTAFVVTRTPRVSRSAKVIACRVSIAPYAWGAVAGHFWGLLPPLVVAPIWMALVAVAAAGVAIFGAHWLSWKYLDAPDWLPLGYVIIGYTMGTLFIPV